MNDRLKQIRLDNKMSQEEFGKKIGIESRSHISALEKGNRNITDRIVNDVCREFNVREEWLRDGIPPKHNETGRKLETYLGQISKGDDDFIKDLIEVYMELDQTSKDALKKIANLMSKKQNERERK